MLSEASDITLITASTNATNPQFRAPSFIVSFLLTTLEDLGLSLLLIERARLHRFRVSTTNTQPVQHSVQLAIQNTTFITSLFFTSYVLKAGTSYQNAEICVTRNMRIRIWARIFDLNANNRRVFRPVAGAPPDPGANQAVDSKGGKCTVNSA